MIMFWTRCYRRISIPPIAEVQLLQEAAADVTGESGEALKKRLRTGTVVTIPQLGAALRR